MRGGPLGGQALQPSREVTRGAIERDRSLRRCKRWILAPAEFGDEAEDETLGALVVTKGALGMAPEEADEETDEVVPEILEVEAPASMKAKPQPRPMSYARLVDEGKREGPRDLSDVRAPDDPGPGSSQSSDDPYDPRPEASFQRDW